MSGLELDIGTFSPDDEEDKVNDTGTKKTARRHIVKCCANRQNGVDRYSIHKQSGLNIVRMLPQAAKAKDRPAAAPRTSDTT